MSVTAQGREDYGLFPGLLRLQCFADREGDGVGGLRRGNDAFGSRELHRGGEAFRLRDRLRVHQPLFIQVRDERGHAVVAQPAGVNGVRDEVVPEGVHFHQRCHAGGVAEVVRVDTPGQGRARGGLGGENARAHLAVELFLDEREGQAGEVGPAAGAPDDQGRGVSRHLELHQCFLPDDRLVQQHVVEHRSEGVSGVGIHGGDLDRF